MNDNLLAFVERAVGRNITLSTPQRAWIKACQGDPLDRGEASAWRRGTGRVGVKWWTRTYKPRWHGERWLIGGRRSLKSTMGASSVLFECLRRAPSPEALSGLIISPGLRQSNRIGLEMVRQFLTTIPELDGQLISETTDSLTLANGVVIRTLPGDPRLVQGFNAAIVWLDEAAGFKDETAVSNFEDVLDAVRPATATVADSVILITTLPGVKSGSIHDAWQSRLERDALVWKTSSVEFNPSLAESEEYKRALKRPEHWKLFYSGEFCDARSALIPANFIESAVPKGRTEVPPEEVSGCWAGLGCDFAQSSDDCAAAIVARAEVDGKDKLVLVWARRWSVKSSELHPIYTYLEEILEACQRYGCVAGCGDQQSLAAAKQFFSERGGIAYERLVTNGLASEPVFDFLREQLRGGRLLLLDLPELVQQMKALEVRRDVGSYEVAAVRGKDDFAVAVAAAAFKAGTLPSVASSKPWFEALDIDEPSPVVASSDLRPGELGPGDHNYPPTHQFGPDRWWSRQ
jgi:hypothetical protein